MHLPADGDECGALVLWREAHEATTVARGQIIYLILWP